MNRAVACLYRRRTWLSAAALLLVPEAAFAHERFIQHDAKWQLQEAFFEQLDANLLMIAGRIAGLIALMLFIWFLRQHPLDDLIEYKLLHNLHGRLRAWVHLLAQFLMDKYVALPAFNRIGEWVVVLFLRSPALVLMFAAANSSLIMPSYPLEPTTKFFFQLAQVVMALLILTQTLLPVMGALILGTYAYLIFAFRGDWTVLVDAMPVLAVAVAYVAAPWNSWNCSITTIGPQQMRWVRIVLGLAFFVLGWAKMYNIYLTVGVADNFPSVMNDPMIKMFYGDRDPHYLRECWITGFALSEVMTGFLLMVGVFSRVWSLLMVFIFTKLMVVDFGWAEIPHLYPIAGFLAVLFSNKLSNEFYAVDRFGDSVARKGGFNIFRDQDAGAPETEGKAVALGRRFGLAYLLTSLALSVLLGIGVIFPGLWALKFVRRERRPNLPVWTAAAAQQTAEAQRALAVRRTP